MAIILLFSACKDFIEPSIDRRMVTLQAPAEGYLSTKYALNFWWDEVDDALSYHLQVVTPDFGAPGSLVLDTVITGHTFTANLDPGDYQWRVRAENGSSVTAYSAANSFSVAQSSIKTQSVQLKLPANGLLNNKAGTLFTWGSLYGATKYRLEIDTNNFTDETQLVLDQTLPGQQVNFSLPKDQIYQWRVRAENDTAQARWSAISQVTLDRTPPGLVVLTSPTSGQTANRPVSFQWQAGQGAVKYKFHLLKADSASPYSQDFPVTLTGTSYTFTGGQPGEQVYWKVSAIDAAGNEGEAGTPRSLQLQ